jgi:hypothetical protein
MEKVLLEDAKKPEAWGKPVRVPASRSPRPVWYGRSKHLELAAKFFLVSVLHRLGAEATLTFAQPHGVDITAVLPSGQTLTIDVKTLPGTRNWWADSFDARKHHFVAFVYFEEAWQTPDPHVVPDIYIWPSERLRAVVSHEKRETISLEFLAAKLDPTEAWHSFTTETVGFRA